MALGVAQHLLEAQAAIAAAAVAVGMTLLEAAETAEEMVILFLRLDIQEAAVVMEVEALGA